MEQFQDPTEGDEDMFAIRTQGDEISVSLSSFMDDVKTTEEGIERKKREKTELIEITNKQLVNINTLQANYEAESVKKSQISTAREANTERFEDAIKQIRNLQNKHYQINELLNLCFKSYDSSSCFIQSDKEKFIQIKELFAEWAKIFESDIKEIEDIGIASCSLLQMEFDKKKHLLESLKSKLIPGRHQKMEDEINTFEELLSLGISKLEQLKTTLSEIKQDWEADKEKSDKIKQSMVEEQARFASNMKEWTIRCERENERLKEINKELEKNTYNIDQLTATGQNSKYKLVNEQRLLSSLQQEFEAKKAMLEKINDECNALKQKNISVMVQVQELEQTAESENETQNKLKNRQDELQGYKDELNQVKALINERKLRNEILEQTYTEIELTNEDLANSTADLTQMFEEFCKATEECQQDKLSRVNTFNTKVEKFRNINLNLEKEIKVKYDVKEEKQMRLETLVKEEEIKRSYINNCNEKILELKEFQKEIEFINFDLLVLLEIIEANQNEKQALEEEIKKILTYLKDIEEKEKRLTDLEESYQIQKKELIDSKKSLLEDKLKDRDQLKSKVNAKAEARKAGQESLDQDYFSAKSDLSQMREDLHNIRSLVEMANVEWTSCKSLLNSVHKTTGISKSEFKKFATQNKSKPIPMKNNLPINEKEEVIVLDDTIVSIRDTSDKETLPEKHTESKELSHIMSDNDEHPIQDDLITGCDDVSIVYDENQLEEEESEDEPVENMIRVKRVKYQSSSAEAAIGPIFSQPAAGQKRPNSSQAAAVQIRPIFSQPAAGQIRPNSSQAAAVQIRPIFSQPAAGQIRPIFSQAAAVQIRPIFSQPAAGQIRPNSSQAAAGQKQPNSSQAAAVQIRPIFSQPAAGQIRPNSSQAAAGQKQPNSSQVAAVQIRPIFSQPAAGQIRPNSSQAAAGQKRPNSSQAAAVHIRPIFSQPAAGQIRPNSSQAAAGQKRPNSSQAAAGQKRPNPSQVAAGQKLPNSSQAAAGQKLPNSSQVAAGQKRRNFSKAAAGDPVETIDLITSASENEF